MVVLMVAMVVMVVVMVMIGNVFIENSCTWHCTRLSIYMF